MAEARVSQAEVVAAMSLATDLAMGAPLESGLKICVLGVGLAERAGLGDEERDRVHDVALLRHAGCTAENQGFASIVGDELAFREGAMAVEATTPGLPPEVQQDLLLANERWDGKSFLKRAKEDGVPVSVRVVQIAETASVYHAIGGTEAAVAVVRERSGGAFDPQLAELFAEHAEELCAEPAAGSAWDAVIESAPARAMSGEAVDAALGAMAEFVDLKSPFTSGHSPAVARLAAEAGDRAGLPAGEVETLRRAGLVHELGQVGVSSGILEKTGTLNADEWEKVRLHTYYGRAPSRRPPRRGAASSRPDHPR